MAPRAHHRDCRLASGVSRPVSIDIAHCRLNLAYSDPGAAAQLRHVWEKRRGWSFDLWADAMTLIGSLDGPPRYPPEHQNTRRDRRDAHDSGQRTPLNAATLNGRLNHIPSEPR